jgi:hypothetical protein
LPEVTKKRKMTFAYRPPLPNRICGKTPHLSGTLEQRGSWQAKDQGGVFPRFLGMRIE